MRGNNGDKRRPSRSNNSNSNNNNNNNNNKGKNKNKQQSHLEYVKELLIQRRHDEVVQFVTHLTGNQKPPPNAIECVSCALVGLCAADRIEQTISVVRSCSASLMMSLPLSGVVESLVRRRRFEKAARVLEGFGLHQNPRWVSAFIGKLVECAQFKLAMVWAEKLAGIQDLTEDEYALVRIWTPHRLVSEMVAVGNYELALKYTREFRLEGSEFTPTTLIRKLLDVGKVSVALQSIKNFGLEQDFPLNNIVDELLRSKLWHEAQKMLNGSSSLEAAFPPETVLLNIVTAHDWLEVRSFLPRLGLSLHTKIDLNTVQLTLMLKVIDEMLVDNCVAEATELVLHFGLTKQYPVVELVPQMVHVGQLSEALKYIRVLGLETTVDPALLESIHAARAKKLVQHRRMMHLRLRQRIDGLNSAGMTASLPVGYVRSSGGSGVHAAGQFVEGKRVQLSCEQTVIQTAQVDVDLRRETERRRAVANALRANTQEDMKRAAVDISVPDNDVSIPSIPLAASAAHPSAVGASRIVPPLVAAAAAATAVANNNYNEDDDSSSSSSSSDDEEILMVGPGRQAIKQSPAPAPATPPRNRPQQVNFSEPTAHSNMHRSTVATQPLKVLARPLVAAATAKNDNDSQSSSSPSPMRPMVPTFSHPGEASNVISTQFSTPMPYSPQQQPAGYGPPQFTHQQPQQHHQHQGPPRPVFMSPGHGGGPGGGPVTSMPPFTHVGMPPMMNMMMPPPPPTPNVPVHLMNPEQHAHYYAQVQQHQRDMAGFATYQHQQMTPQRGQQQQQQQLGTTPTRRVSKPSPRIPRTPKVPASGPMNGIHSGPGPGATNGKTVNPLTPLRARQKSSAKVPKSQADTSLLAGQWPSLSPGKPIDAKATDNLANSVSDNSNRTSLHSRTVNGTNGNEIVTRNLAKTTNAKAATAAAMVLPVTPPPKAKTSSQSHQAKRRPTTTPISMMMMPTSVILSQKKKKETTK